MSLIDPKLFEGDAGLEGPAMASPYASSGAAKPVGADFRDPRPLTRWLSGFLYADLVCTGLLALAFLAQAAGMEVLYLDEAAELTPLQATFSLFAIAYVAFSIARILLVLRWFWRANKNARALSRGLETTPGWAWGFFFIPIMNLFRPFKTMEEIWQSAMKPHGWRGVPTPVLMRWWWGLWLAGNITDNISGRMIDRFGMPAEGSLLSVFGYALSVGATVAFLRLITTIAEHQWRASQDGVFD